MIDFFVHHYFLNLDYKFILFEIFLLPNLRRFFCKFYGSVLLRRAKFILIKYMKALERVDLSCSYIYLNINILFKQYL